MNWHTILISIFAFSICSQCFADRYLQPVKSDEQEEILVQGASVLMSQKKHVAMMYQTSEMVEGRRANFFVAVGNRGERSINLHFENLSVSDQNGNYIRVVPKQELIAAKKSQANWRLFASALCAGLESVGAQQAGRTEYCSTTSGTGLYNSHAIGSNGWSNSSGSVYGTSLTHGVMYSEAARQQALRQVQIDADCRSNGIKQQFKDCEYGLDNFYFDSNTVFPDSIYEANVQVDIPRDVEKQIEYLVFHLSVGDETHTFYFYCGMQKKKWYQALCG